MNPWLSCAIGAVAAVLFMTVLPMGRSADLVVGLYVGFIVGVIAVCVLERCPKVEDDEESGRVD